jgi:hypothetical protein
MFSTNNQKLIEQAVEKGFLVVEQAYQLEDTVTHQRFGRYGQDAFGHSYGLGIRVGQGILLRKSLLTPWEQDENFGRYRESHTPVLSLTCLRELNDSVKREVKLSPDTLGLHSPSLFNAPDSTNHIIGFQVQRFQESEEGWLVWITANKAISESEKASTTLTIYKKAIKFNADSLKYEVEAPQVSRIIWGGVFIVPMQTEIGQLTFKLGGVVVASGLNQWRLEVPTLPALPAVSAPTTSEELTPLNENDSSNNKKKNKKKK